MTYIPKPSEQSKPRTRITKDGRLQESPYRYRKTKAEMLREQGNECANCFRPIYSPEEADRHHPGGRGLGGSKRDDSKTVLWCENCHVREHEAQRQGRP